MMSDLRTSYREKRDLLTKLKSQAAIYDERLSFAELGVYEPHFDFDDSETYKQKIKEVRDRQKGMVAAKQATNCPTDWTVDGSRSKGQTMVNRQTRLTMRAFNNECEAAIANTRWNNVVAMEKRISNAPKQINGANDSMKLVINDNYVALKIDELHLTHEYREQFKIEKEERAELARAEREEKRKAPSPDGMSRKVRRRTRATKSSTWNPPRSPTSSRPRPAACCTGSAEVGMNLPVGALLGIIAPEGVDEAAIEEFVSGFVVQDVEGGTSRPANPTVNADGRNIRYTVYGEEGKLIVLVHGFGGDMNAWMFNQDALAADHAVYSLDLSSATRRLLQGGR